MQIKNLNIRDGMYVKSFIFNSKTNIIYSKYNGRGKTTLLRFILYSLGYEIPSTKGMSFKKYCTEIELSHEDSSTIKLIRDNKNHILLVNNKDKYSYILPVEKDKLHKRIFNNNNNELLNNLLGVFYADQEFGWSYLNVGTPIYYNTFDSLELIRGLANTDCSELQDKKEYLTHKKNRLSDLNKIATYQDNIKDDKTSIAEYNDEIESRLDELSRRERQLKEQLERINKSIDDNNQARDFINSMKLVVKMPDGIEKPFEELEIVGLGDSTELLKTKKTLATENLNKILEEIRTININKDHSSRQMKLFNSEESLDAAESGIRSIKIPKSTIKIKIKEIQAEINTINSKIQDKTFKNKEIIDKINELINKYCNMLNVKSEEKEIITLDYKNKNKLSGALLHKTSFAFRLAFIKSVYNILNIRLPIILDSPNGGEIDKTNIDLMIDVLNKEFNDHQIIVASIEKNYLKADNIIELKESLLENSKTINPTKKLF